LFIGALLASRGFWFKELKLLALAENCPLLRHHLFITTLRYCVCSGLQVFMGQPMTLTTSAVSKKVLLSVYQVAFHLLRSRLPSAGQRDAGVILESLKWTIAAIKASH